MHGVTVEDCQRSIRRLSVEIDSIAEELDKRLDENPSSEFVLPLIDKLKEVISARINWENRLVLLKLEESLRKDEESARIN